MEPEYLTRLRDAIWAVHGCRSIHSATMHVKAGMDLETQWEGNVEVFDISGHRHAKKCYAWGTMVQGEFAPTCVLEIPPVDSPSTAVEAALGRFAS